MTDPLDIIVGVVSLNGGKLVGKTRLQKVTYLLDACGMKSGFEYDYHHFGPYSAEVASSADLAELIGRISSEEKPGFHSVPYVTFSTEESKPDRLGALTSKKISEKLSIMESYSAIVLELAATLHYLEHEEGYTQPGAQEEIKIRKTAKASPERLQQANDLLRKLALN